MDSSQKQYTVLARRFRPQIFDEVVGQQHIAQALKNAISASRVAHAYLFTGARGVGKTSMARILAKALNCANLQDGNPCNDCEICQGISDGHDVDVLEIDGASNRGIDDIRALRANINVKSMRTQFKMYIIDEVHMLTKEAFNALLKTLEEPPPNVKFVFATTEPNKLPDTILSRCQRFDFSTIEITSIIDRLQQIAKVEGYEVSEDALELVARRAAGSMRDSQSLFDQLLAFGEENITAADVHRLLGTANDERLIELVNYMMTQNRKETLECFDKTLGDGVQIGELLDQIINYFRDLMVISTGADQVSLISVSNNSRQILTEQVKLFGIQTIMAGIQILAETKTKIFRASFGRALVEMALIRITLLKNLDALGDLVAAIRQGVPIPVTNISNPSAVISAPVNMAPSNHISQPNDAATTEAANNKTITTENITENESQPAISPPVISESVPSSSSVPSNSIPEATNSVVQVAEEVPPKATDPEPKSITPQPEPVHSEPEPPPEISEQAVSEQAVVVTEPEPDVVQKSAAEPVTSTPEPVIPESAAPVKSSQVESAPNLDSDSGQNVIKMASSSSQSTIEAEFDSLNNEINHSEGDSDLTLEGIPESVPLKTINFVPENEKEFLSQVIAISNDTVKPHLSKVGRAAITGPNRLDLQFPVNYSFPRKICEKPENAKVIAEFVSQVAGKQIQVAFSHSNENAKPSLNSASDNSENVTEKPRSVAKQVPKVGEDVGDVLVDKAVEVFKASIVRVDGIQRL